MSNKNTEAQEQSNAHIHFSRVPQLKGEENANHSHLRTQTSLLIVSQVID